MSGTVDERLAAGGYTYLAVRRDDGTVVWTVTVGAGAPVGAMARAQILKTGTPAY